MKTPTPATPAVTRQGTATYRAYVLNVQDPINPTVQVAYIQANKYGPAWKAARALVATGKPHEEVPATTSFFADDAGTQPLDVGFGDHVVIATVTDLKPKTVKLDQAKLQAILADDSLSVEARLDAAKALAGA